jgi:hypothetical protein
MGCDQSPKGKADSDFQKREAEANTDAVFIFVTPRLWKKKDEWAEAARARGLWKDVRAFDATDLENWLESAAGVHVWFAEQLGIAGPGIESPEHAWLAWSSQTVPAISETALLTGRDEAVRKLNAAIDEKKSIVRIRADSIEEAMAFAALVLTRSARNCSAVVTEPTGWRFVDAHAGINVTVAASRETGAARPLRDGFTLIVLASQTSPGAHESQGETVVLDRPTHRDFETALVQMGRDPSDAARLSRSTGRSWSVYRRVHAANPAISHPPWLDDAALLHTLSTLTLMGHWNGGRSGDTACVAEVDGRNYEDLEYDLRRLARMDDPPVLQIGTVWHAKAPLELVYLVGPRLTQSQLSRFFRVAMAVLAAPDPVLELDEDKRWMAAVYGKVREQSGLVLDAMAESIAKLSVYAERSTDPQRDRIIESVDGLVRTLLDGATGARWLSLAGLLPELAEASPDAFLEAVERSLEDPAAPVRRLIEETNGSDIGSRAWHTGLLWALEMLAWAPSRLANVAFVLCKLTSTRVKGNWSNTPANSLKSLFRTWWPQTAASQEQRLAVLDQLLKRYPDAAWRLLVDLLSRDDIASLNAVPKWREDNAGVTEPVRERAVVIAYGRALKQRALAAALQAPKRASDLLDCTVWLDPADDPELIELFEKGKELPDADRAAVRSRLRRMLSWHNSFDTKPDSPTRRLTDLLTPYFDALAPSDLVLRHCWVFESGWVDLPEGREDHDYVDRLRQERRTAAWSEILPVMGLEGALALLSAGADPRLVGWEVARANPSSQALAGWLAALYVRGDNPSGNYLISGVLHGCVAGEREAVLRAIQPLMSSVQLGKFLTLAPISGSTWELVDSLGAEVSETYWETVPQAFFGDSDPDGEFMIHQLAQRGRARTALQVLGHRRRRNDAERAVALLERIAAGEEPDGPIPRSWDVTDIAKHAREAGVDRRRLAMVELQYHAAFEHDQTSAVDLYEEMLSDPALFVEVVKTAYPPSPDGEYGRGERTEHEKAAWELAFSVAREGSGAPGMLPDGTIDTAAFARWLEEASRLANEHRVLKAFESTIGAWIAGVRVALDSWPPGPIRDVLEEGTDTLRHGFSSGVFNARGITSRGVFDGGGQERELAARYRSDATSLQVSHPKVSHMLLCLARDYERFGRSEDDEAQLRRESP